MTGAPPPPRHWRRWIRAAAAPRRGWRQWTLRARLAATLTVLAACALVAANGAGVLMLRGHLVDQIDERLAAMGHRAARTPPGTPTPRPGPALRASASDVLLYVYDDAGAVVSRVGTDPQAPGPRLPSYGWLRDRAGAGPFTLDGAAGGWRTLVQARDGGGVVVLTASLREVQATTGSLLLIDVAAGGVVLAALGAVGLWVVRIGLSPLTRMGEVADRITVGDLSRRIPHADPHTEPGRLAATLNSMLARLESEVAARARSEHRLRRFLADASHELRTPLTSIRGFAELYRRGGAPPGPALDETMGRIEDEAARMGLLVDDLLLLARLDLQRPMDHGRVDLTAVAADTVRDARVREPGRVITLTGLAGGPVPVTVPGDAHRLRQVATNLVTNALQHTPDSASVTVRVGRRDPGTAVLQVVDTGPGIAAAHAARVFERLYRVDASRSRSLGGAGLGLAIVAAIVHAHGGAVTLTDTPGGGATFEVCLPAPADP
ncbi:MAG TPA: HAMP domain-containing sensor histidine kinase [Pilimelia sp.]|nr:HAMP domain-containing sensor histidine kinase [Pilimelia sp.]